MLETPKLGGKCADLNALFVGLARASGIPARDVYGVRVAKSEFGYRASVCQDNVTRAQHFRAEFYVDSHGWCRSIRRTCARWCSRKKAGVLLPLDDAQVKAARAKLFGAWEMKWLAFNTAHDVALPKAAHGKVAFLMYPQCETAAGRLDTLDPDNFRYQMTSRKLASA